MVLIMTIITLTKTRSEVDGRTGDSISLVFPYLAPYIPSFMQWIKGCSGAQW